MLESFRLGGWGMIPTLIFGLIFIGVSIRYAQRPEKRYLPLVVSVGTLTLLTGTLGFVTGMIATMAHTAPDTPPMALVGFGESLHNFALAFALLVIGTIAVVAGAWRVKSA